MYFLFDKFKTSMSKKISPEGKNLVYKNTNRPSYFKGNTGEFQHDGVVVSIAMDDQYIVAGTGNYDDYKIE